MSDMSNHPAGTKKAVIHRMVMPNHTCPYGLKAVHLLKRAGYEVEDHHLTTREETDAFKAQHGVATTPQIFISGQRIGGHDDLRRFLGKRVADPKATSYRPVIALFSVTALTALAASHAVTGSVFTLLAAEWFIGFSMVVLALLKLQNIESFATMFLNYDLLAKRWVPYSYIYPFAEGLAGVLMISGALTWLSVPIALFIATDRGSVGVQGRLHRQARAEMRLRRRLKQRAARLHLADRKPDDDRHGSLDGSRRTRPRDQRSPHDQPGPPRTLVLRPSPARRSLHDLLTVPPTIDDVRHGRPLHRVPMSISCAA
jgi:glutaredoxin